MASSSSTSSVQSDLIDKVAQFEYEGEPRYCKCKRMGRRLKAPRKTSWSDENPGRRYFGCRFWHPNPAKNRSCGYFEWFDGEMNERATELLNKLKMENKMLKAEIKHMAKKCRGDIEDEVSDLWAELRKLKKGHHNREEEIRSERKKRKTTMLATIVSWILLVYIVIWLK